MCIDGEYYLALTGRGSDLSWEICYGYILLGCHYLNCRKENKMGDTFTGVCRICGIETDLINGICEECFLTQDDKRKIEEMKR